MKLAPRSYEFFFLAAIPGYYVLLSLAIYFDVTTRLVTLPIRIAPLIFLAVAYLISFRPKKVPYNKLNMMLFILFSCLYMGRILYDGVIEDNLAKQSWMAYISYYILSVFLPALFLIRINSSLISLRLEKVFFYGMLILTILLTFLYYNKLGTYRVKGVEDGTMSALAIGYIGALMVALSLNIIINKTIKNHINPAIAYLAITASIIPIILSASRGPIVAIFLSIFIIVIRTNTKRKYLKIALLSAFTIAMSGYFVSFVNKTGSSVIDRIANLGDDIQSGSSSTVRIEIWQKTISQYLESPILGAQLEVFNDHPHNVIFEAFMSTGTVGGSIFLYLILVASYRAYKSANDPNLSWLSVLFFIAIAQNSFSGAIWAAAWLIIPVAIFIGIQKRT